MLTVNLEKELLRQPVSKVSANELLYIKEYDRLGADISKSEILTRIGINSALLKGKRIKSNHDNNLSEASKFNTDKVYHISQIEKLCKRYYLRFLPSAMFAGSVDVRLADEISTFEATYGVKCVSAIGRRFTDEERYNNTFIAAPKSSFALQEKPKDPLLFYKINEEYYYLIHKWGNDLSLFRRVYNLLESSFLVWFISLSLLIFFISNIHPKKGDIDGATSGINLIFSILIGVFCIVNFIIGEGQFSFIKKNEITSRYL